MVVWGVIGYALATWTLASLTPVAQALFPTITSDDISFYDLGSPIYMLRGASGDKTEKKNMKMSMFYNRGSTV